jgi:O-antigen ligase
MSGVASRGPATAKPTAARQTLAPRWDAAALAVALLLFAGHVMLGANRTDLSLAFAMAWFIALAVLTTRPWAEAALARARLLWPGAAFAAVLALAVLSLTPLAPGGVHAVWAWVGAPVKVGAIDPYATIVELVKLAALAAAFLIGCSFGADDDRARGLMRAVLQVGLVFSAWAFLDYVLNPNFLFGAARPFAPDRLSGAFGSPNTAATCFGALTLLNLVDVLRAYEGAGVGGRFYSSTLQRLLPRLARPLAGLALAATCLTLTQSRAGLAAAAAVAIVLAAVLALARAGQGGIRTPLIAIAAVALALVVGSAALNVDALQQRFLFLHADAALRSQIFAAHFAAFQAAPWGGYGLGSFARINGMILSGSNLAALQTIGAAHNVYIQWLEEAGVLGAAAMFATVALIALQLALGLARRRRMRPWLLAILAVLALYLLHGASDYALETPSMAAMLSLLLGLGAGIAGAAPVARAGAGRALGQDVDLGSAAAGPAPLQVGRYRTSGKVAQGLHAVRVSERDLS